MWWNIAAVGERRWFGACGAQRRNRRQQPRRAPGRSNADAAQIDVDRPPANDEAHALETRRLAHGKRRRQMAQPPRARTLAAQQPGFERVRVADREQREHPRTRRGDPPRREQRSPAAHCRRRQSGGASRASKVAAFPCGWTAGSGAYGGGEWVKVGAHELTTRPARAAADDSGFIVSESLTPLSRFHHGAGGAD